MELHIIKPQNKPSKQWITVFSSDVISCSICQEGCSGFCKCLLSFCQQALHSNVFAPFGIPPRKTQRWTSKNQSVPVVMWCWLRCGRAPSPCWEKKKSKGINTVEVPLSMTLSYNCSLVGSKKKKPQMYTKHPGVKASSWMSGTRQLWEKVMCTGFLRNLV